MTRDDIIRMADQAFNESSFTDAEVLRFAALVRDYLLSTDIHSCHADCQRFACVQTRRAVQAEREAYAKLCDEMEASAALSDIEKYRTRFIADAIRARGQQC